MKVILKYLRTVNSFSQQEIADAIGLSRQSYNKYEAGTVIPSDKIVEKLADFYKVEVSFIKQNKIPAIPGKEKKDLYSKRPDSEGVETLESAAPSYCEKVITPSIVPPVTKFEKTWKLKTYNAYYSNGHIVLEDNDLKLKDGQRLQVAIRTETEAEEESRRKKAWEILQSFINSKPFADVDKEKDYDTLRWEALQEKYGPF